MTVAVVEMATVFGDGNLVDIVSSVVFAEVLATIDESDAIFGVTVETVELLEVVVIMFPGFKGASV